VVGDNPADLNERGYGNPDVAGPDAKHGTHVAGIIAANRDNGYGAEGIAAPVQIMAVRAVPNGDERDKDVANAIRYAVDNGAHIINMSFGKSYSPQKQAVDEAVRYAEANGVLLVHAAGNDGKDVDTQPNYPSDRFLGGQTVTNWISVGASGWQAGEAFVASFSNYGQAQVDLFAPGVQIHSTLPGSTYGPNQGTSMAAPMVSGVAALVWAYYPALTATQLKDVLLRSAVRYSQEKVVKPGTEDEAVPFNTLSVTGGVVNAYEALKLAASMVP
jgi:subtilisin family serine protease